MSADVRTALSACPDAEQLSALQCPALIISGERSPKPARRVADLLASRLTQAKRVTLASVGHMAPVRQPELTAERIQEALRQESRSPQQVTWQRVAA
jgi:pimeloyl-ACP methyl ester carboxylesterase